MPGRIFWVKHSSLASLEYPLEVPSVAGIWTKNGDKGFQFKAKMDPAWFQIIKFIGGAEALKVPPSKLELKSSTRRRHQVHSGA